MMLILLYQMIVYRIMGSANVKYSKFVLTLLLIWVFPIIQKEFPLINWPNYQGWLILVKYDDWK